MKDIKSTVKAMIAHWQTWTKELWKHYLLFAAMVTVFAYSFMRVCATTLMPIALLWSETHNWDFILAIVGLDIVWVTVCLLSAIAMAGASVVAHRQMKRVVGKYEKREMSKSHRNVLTCNVLMLFLGSVMIALLPASVVFVSYNAAALSGMMLDSVPTPTWVHASMFSSTFAGILFCEIMATFSRLCYRDISIPATDTDYEPEIPLTPDLSAPVSPSR